MAISSVYSGLLALHGKSVQFLGKCLHPRNISIFEISTIVVSSLSLASLFQANGSLLSSAFLYGGALVAGCVASVMYKRTISSPSILAQIKNTVRISKKNRLTMLLFREQEEKANASYMELDYVQKASKKYSIDLIDGDSPLPWDRHCPYTDRIYDRIDIVAHGDNESIEMSPDFDLTANSDQALKWFSGHIKKGGVLSLNCCSVAEGEENIARTISRVCPEATVRGPSQIIDVTLSLNCNQSGFPTYTDLSLCKKKNITRIYRNGNRIQRKRGIDGSYLR